MQNTNLDYLPVKIHRKTLLNNKTQNALFLINAEEGDFIVRTFKKSYNSKGFFRRVYSFLVPMSTSFLNELYTYEKLNNSNLKWLKHPKLRATDYKNYIMIDYIQHDVKKSNIKNIDQEMLIKALIEFGTCCIYSKKTYGFRYWLKRQPRKVSIEIFRSSIFATRKISGINVSVKCIALLMISKLKSSRVQSINVHKDLSCIRNGQINNIIVDETGEIYFFDFETATLEKEWILVDIIDICWSESFFNPNIKLLTRYLEKLKTLGIITEKNIKNQIRVALLRRSMRMINSPSVIAEDKKKWKQFLSQVVLINKNYENWYNCTILGNRT